MLVSSCVGSLVKTQIKQNYCRPKDREKESLICSHEFPLRDAVKQEGSCGFRSDLLDPLRVEFLLKTDSFAGAILDSNYAPSNCAPFLGIPLFASESRVFRILLYF